MDFNSTSSLSLRSRGWGDLVCLCLCFLSFAFLLAGKLIPPVRSGFRLTPLMPSVGGSASISGSGFAADAVYPETLKPITRGAIKFYGSWIGSDASTGSAHSAWYDVKPESYIYVAGYPNHPGLKLLLETFSGSPRSTSSLLTLKSDPGLHWELLKLPFRNISSPAKFRIVADDQSKTSGGWIGFSTPFVSPVAESPQLVRQLLFVLLATSAAIVMLVSPGLLLRDIHFRRSGKLLPFIWIPVAGFLGCGLLGLVSWTGPSWASGKLISTTAIFALCVYLAHRLIRSSIYTCTSQAERRALLIFIVLTAVAVAKAIYSVGPVGELYRDTVSRTLQVGDRSDSRISFHVVQLIALRERPYHALAQRFFNPWNFSSRGPLAGLAASPLVLTSGVHVPTSFPDQPWMVFDPEGFMAYRIAMIVMATSCLLMVFGLSAALMPEQWALLAFLVTITSPFVIHEIYFTWPKLEAASFVLFAAYLLLRLQSFGGGLALGVGYLCHPSALLSVPALLGLIPFAKLRDFENLSAKRKLLTWTLSSIFLFLGLALWMALWRLVNRHHFDQGGFLSYVSQADQMIPNAGNWVKSRLDSLLNTIVPLNLFLFHRNHPAVNSVDGPSPPVVSFFFQDWTSLPFGIGLAYFFCLLRLGYLALKKAPGLTLLLYVVPLVIFTIYWGAASTGMLREGLHAWFLSVTIGSILVLEKFADSDHLFFRLVSWALLFRIVELLCMLLLPSIWTEHRWLRPEFRLSDLVALFIMFAGTAWLVRFTFLQSEALRLRYRAAKSAPPVLATSS